MKNYQDYVENIRGPLVLPGITEAIGYYKSHANNGEADLEISFNWDQVRSLEEWVKINGRPQVYKAFFEPHVNQSTCSITVMPFRPRIRGTVMLIPANVFGKPIIDPRYLDNYES